MSQSVGIIASFSVRAGDIADSWQETEVQTRFGAMPVLTTQVAGTRLVYLTRSGGRQGVAPHLVQYRAVIDALRVLGIRRALATSVVGSLTRAIPVGSLVVLDQYLDFTRTRITTMFGSGRFVNVDVTDPYCPVLRHAVLAAGGGDDQLRPHGCYVGVDGPRYETRAEVEMYRRLGGDVIGMTGLPEAVLAREAGICFASLAIVSNLGAGLADGPVAQADHARTVGELGGVVGPLLRRAAVAGASSTRACGCGTVPQSPPPPGEPGGEPFAGDADGDGDGELTLVLLRPSVLGDRQVGRAISALEKVAALRAVKSVLLDAHAIDAIYDRPGIANLLPGIRNAHVGLPAVVLALGGSPGTCAAVEREVEKIRAVVARDALHNGVHASGDPQTARRELALFFAPDELAGAAGRERRTEPCGVA